LSIERLTEEYRVIKRFESFVLGFCRCKCGEPINIKNKTNSLLVKYKKGHQMKGKIPSGEKSPHYKGGIKMNGKYRMLLSPNHPFKDKQGYVREHRLIYEHYLKILFDEDIYIPKEIDIHHIISVSKGGTNALINLTCVTKPEHTKIHNPKKDRTEFKCIYPNCKNPNETYTTKEGYPHWYEYNNGWICSRCYRKLTKKPEEKEKYKEYYERNKEKMRSKSLQYHYKNREKNLQKMRKRYRDKKINYNQYSLEAYV
jgi:hypothetical protein